MGAGFFWSHRNVGSHEPTKSKSVGETQVQIRRPLDYNQAAARTAGKSPELRRQDKNKDNLRMGGRVYPHSVRAGRYRNGIGSEKGRQNKIS